MKVLGNFLAGIISVVYFFVLFFMMILIFASNVFSADYYEEILNDVDLAEIKVADLGITSYSEEFGEDASVEDVLVQLLEAGGVSRSDAIKIINSEKLNEVVGDFISDTMNYLVNQEEVPQLEYQDVEEILKSDEVSSVLEDTPNDEEVKQLVDQLNVFIVENFEKEVNQYE